MGRRSQIQTFEIARESGVYELYNHIDNTEKYDLGIDIIAQKDDVRWGFK